VMKSHNSLGGWDGILRLAIRGEGCFERSKRVISRNVVRQSRWIHFGLLVKAATLSGGGLRCTSSGLFWILIWICNDRDR
jgi:hypothetical protein